MVARTTIVALATTIQSDDVTNGMTAPAPKASGIAANSAIASATPNQPSQAGRASYRRIPVAAAPIISAKRGHVRTKEKARPLPESRTGGSLPFGCQSDYALLGLLWVRLASITATAPAKPTSAGKAVRYTAIANGGPTGMKYTKADTNA